MGRLPNQSVCWRRCDRLIVVNCWGGGVSVQHPERRRSEVRRMLCAFALDSIRARKVRELRMFVSAIVLSACLAVPLLAFPSAASAAPGDSCRRSSDCDDGERCRQRRCVVDDDDDDVDVAPPRGGRPQRPTSTNVCVTPFGACQIFQFGPSGYPCFCNTFQGPVNGVLR
jgi:hypothetical protein